MSTLHLVFLYWSSVPHFLGPKVCRILRSQRTKTLSSVSSRQMCQCALLGTWKSHLPSTGSIPTSVRGASVTSSKRHMMADDSKVLDHLLLQHLQIRNSFISYKSGDQRKKASEKNYTHCKEREREDGHLRRQGKPGNWEANAQMHILKDIPLLQRDNIEIQPLEKQTVLLYFV